MGRKERKDIDYFPFFVKDGRTLFILEGKYQCKGVGFFTNLFRFLSKTPDHHFQLKTDADKLFFFTSVKCDEESAIDMIEIMVATGKLDLDLWRKKSVLTSQDFLESIQEAYRKRSNNCITLEEIKQKFNITTGRNTQEGEKLPEEIHIVTTFPPVTSGLGAQSKVKESKVKEGKPSPPTFFSCDFFEIEKPYLEKLLLEFKALTPEKLNNEFSKMEDFLSDNYKNYKRKADGKLKNPKSFIRNWLERIKIPPGSYNVNSQSQDKPNDIEILEKGYQILINRTEQEFLKFCTENNIPPKDQKAIRGKKDTDGFDLKSLTQRIKSL